MGLYNTIQTGGVLYLLFAKDGNDSIALWVLVMAWLIQAILETILGRKDYKKWKLAQREGVLSASYTPLTIETYDMLKDIHQKVCPERFDSQSVLDEYRNNKEEIK